MSSARVLHSYDEIIELIGSFGPYQRQLLLLAYLPIMFTGMHVMGFLFTNAVPKHRCYVSSCDNRSTSYCEDFLNTTTPFDDSSSDFSSCDLYSHISGNNSLTSSTCPNYEVDRNHTTSCGSWKYDQSVYERTTVSRDLVCDRSYEVALSQSIYMAGIMVGSVVYGMIADRAQGSCFALRVAKQLRERYKMKLANKHGGEIKMRRDWDGRGRFGRKFGRKIGILIGLLIGSSMATGSTFVPNYPFFLALRFFTGASFQGVYQTTFVMSVELVGKSERAFCGMLVSIYFAVGEVILGIIAYFIRDWEHLQLVISVPPFIFLIYFWIIPESPRWLIAHNRISEAKVTLERIAESNSKTIPYHMLNTESTNIVEKYVDSSFEVSQSSSLETKDHHSVFDLFRTPRLRWRSINIFINWLMNTIAYYGITMSTPSLGVNEFWSFVIISAVEIPSYIFGMLVLDRLGRRFPLCGCMIVGGIAGTCTALVPSTPEYVWLSITLTLIGKFGAASAFGIIYVFSAELFPTVVRNNGIGMGAMFGNTGCVVAPYIATLSSINPALPLVIFGVCSLLSGLAAFTLPETLGQQLPETLENAENFGRFIVVDTRRCCLTCYTNIFRKSTQNAEPTERLHLLYNDGPGDV